MSTLGALKLPDGTSGLEIESGSSETRMAGGLMGLIGLIGLCGSTSGTAMNKVPGVGNESCRAL